MYFIKLLFSTTAALAEPKKRLLKVALIGAPNAGKSTLLNKILGTNVSCVSKKVHTTRANVLGVYTENDTQLEFLDTPGVINKEHLLRHHLEDSLLVDPTHASSISDIIVVLVDASNHREQRSLHKGVLNLLHKNTDTPSILVLNKVDLIGDKRSLLDIGTRLTQGCLNGICTMKKSQLLKMSRARLKELNLTEHLGQAPEDCSATASELVRTKHKYVIDLDEQLGREKSFSRNEKGVRPDSIGFKNFSHVFSISALNDEGVQELRDHLLSRATFIEEWPHGPDYVSSQSTQDIVHGIIRGKVLDYVKDAVPYLLKYKYLECAYDEMGSLHIHLVIECSEAYMVAAVIGTQGVFISRIIEESRSMIENTLRCDVRLNIVVVVRKSRDDSRRVK